MTKPDLTSLQTRIPYFDAYVQKVFPAVYDDALSYYELLSKVINHLNEIGALTNETVEKWSEVMNWVMSDGLKESVFEKLDMMLQSGELLELMNDLIGLIGSLTDFRPQDQTVIEKLKKESQERGYNIVWFGADGTPENDHLALTAAIDYIQSNQPNGVDQGGTIIIPHGVWNIGEVEIIGVKHLTIKGEGVVNGSLHVKAVETLESENNLKDIFFTIEGIKFIGQVGSENDCITFSNIQKATVRNCYFENYATAIKGVSTTVDVTYQQTNRISIINNRMRNVDYGVQVTYIPYDTSSPTTWRYSQHGDWLIEGNYFECYSRGISHVYLTGMDGFIIRGNYCFFMPYTACNTHKRNNIYIEQSNFGVIEGNNLFEAGEYAVKCLSPRSLSIANNNCAWGGQAMEGGGIYVETIDRATWEEANINISGNNISAPSRFGIYIGYSVINAVVSNNIITRTGETRYYYGQDLSSKNKYSIFVGQHTTSFTEEERVSIVNNLFDGALFQYRGYASNTPISVLDVKEPFGRFAFLTEDLADTLDLSSLSSRNRNAINKGFPIVLKNANGTLDRITGGEVGQIVTLIVNGSLTLNNTGTGDDLLHIGSTITLSTSEYVTLQKTNSYWIKVGKY